MFSIGSGRSESGGPDRCAVIFRVSATDTPRPACGEYANLQCQGNCVGANCGTRENRHTAIHIVQSVTGNAAKLPRLIPLQAIRTRREILARGLFATGFCANADTGPSPQPKTAVPFTQDCCRSQSKTAVH
jgi:hypothetical protein